MVQLSVLGLLACVPQRQPVELPPSDTATAVGGVHQGEALTGNALLRRISLDIRGIPPTLDELERFEEDPESLDALIDEYLDDDRYPDRLVEIFGDLWLTRIDEFNVGVVDYNLPDSQEFPFLKSVGEETLRLMAYVASEDLPWSEIVTADYTVANELLASIWPLDYPEGASGWAKSHYTDGRPPGGVVMTNGVWWRYYTTPNNFGRTRAAAISRLLLCEDYLLRPISFESPSLLERDDLDEATRTQDACVGCHNTLDPLAAGLFGFWWFDHVTAM